MAGPFTVRYVPLTVTTPAGTAIGAPQTTPVPIFEVVLLDVHLIVPHGHSGLTGIRFVLSQQQILPWDNGPTWIVGDRIDTVFEVNNEVGSLLNVVTYNTDIFDHKHYLLFKVTDIPQAEAAPLQLLDITPAGS